MTERPNVSDSRKRAGITFPVDDVQWADQLIWTESLEECLTHRLARKVLILSGRDRPVTGSFLSILTKNNLDRSLFKKTSNWFHPLVDVVHVAFSDHRPLTISPDDVWLVIAQGFGRHVNENPEALGSRLVKHPGKRELTARVNDFSLETWQQAIASFSSQIREATDPVLHETLVCDFSTTTPAIRTASEVALMDTYSRYFEYFVDFVCGIPQITIAGTVKDWQRIRARVEVLATYDLEWWIQRLRPILDEFVLAASGHPTPSFWKAIYKPEKAYGGEAVTGWIADLFPYLEDPPKSRRNRVFQFQRQDWAVTVKQGIEPDEFPKGLSQVPVLVTLPGHSQCDVELVAGFFAIEQHPTDLGLSTLIGWSVAEQTSEKVA